MSRSKTSLQLALVLSPKSIPTELSVLGNTSGKLLLQNLGYINPILCVSKILLLFRIEF